MKNVRDEFLEQLKSQSGIEKLFEYISDVHFWAKNLQFRFVLASQSVAEKCGCANEKEMIGKTDFDIHHNQLAVNYRRDDEFVIHEGRRIENRIELVTNEDGTVDWHSTTKIPLYSKKGDIMGVAGITKKLRKADINVHPHFNLAKALDYISRNYSKQIEIGVLAQITGFSRSQFDRRFKQAFQITSEKFINSVRIRAACKMLVNGRESIKQIAYKAGFCNQSYFSKQFRLLMGLSPKQYRVKFFKGN
jgi:AraC-like DNA-binding protein